MAAIEPEFLSTDESPGPSERVDPESVEQLVAEVNRIYVRKALEAAHEVGRLVLERYFEGDAATFRRTGNQHASYRALAAHPDLTVSASWLWYAVQLVEHLAQLPDSVSGRLSLSHHRLLIHVQEPLRMQELAEAAAEDGWSKRRLKREIDGHGTTTRSAQQARKLGRPRHEPVRKALSNVVRCMAMEGQGALTPAVFDHWEPEEAMAMVAEARARMAKLEALCGQLEGLADNWHPTWRSDPDAASTEPSPPVPPLDHPDPED